MICRSLAVALTATLCAAPVDAVAQDGDAKKKAAKLLDEGVGRFEATDYAAALDRFQAAYQLYPSPKILLNIGQALRKLGRDEQAAQAYDRFLAENAAAPDVGDAKLSSARAALGELLPRLGRIRVEVEPADATLAVDGRTLGTGREVRTIFVKPGAHAVAAESKGFVPRTERIEISAAEEKRLTLRLDLKRDELPVVTATQPPPAPPAAPVERPRRRVFTWVAAGGAVVLAGAGTFFGIRAGSAYDDLKRASARDDLARYDDARSRVSGNSRLANVCLAGAAGAAVAAVALFIYEGKPASGGETSVAAAPWSGGGGVDVGVRF